ncbi:hypothetical protein [Kitasatospora sp. NPDC094011]|uniref:hypothetical protein n=1 Tax=Kitasatospora sp. NPDC094011 TaxID=3364090 RepID=UPI0037FE56BF
MGRRSGRIIDSEDPRSALGTIKPRRIMDIADAVPAARRELPVQLSTDIGEDRTTPHGDLTPLS